MSEESVKMRKPSIILYSDDDISVTFNKRYYWVNMRADLIGKWTENDDEIRILKNRLDPKQRLVSKATFDDIANEIYSRLYENKD